MSYVCREATTGGVRRSAEKCAPDTGCREGRCLRAAALFPNASNPMRACRTALNGTIYGRILMGCSRKIADNTIHNANFGKSFPGVHVRWHQLPSELGINVDSRRLWHQANLSRARVVHFMGVHKPWHGAQGRPESPSFNSAVREYQHVCGELGSAYS